MQVIDDHVIVPKPYGPRMTMNNALTVLGQVLPAEQRAKLSAGTVTRRGLDRSVHWAFAPIAPLNPALAEVEPAQRTDLARLARVFGDGFGERPVVGEHRPGPQLDVDQILARNKTAIMNANKRGLFGAGEALRKGWNRIVIPEPTVDLFQAYADFVLTGLGLTVHWVDSVVLSHPLRGTALRHERHPPTGREAPVVVQSLAVPDRKLRHWFHSRLLWRPIVGWALPCGIRAN